MMHFLTIRPSVSGDSFIRSTFQGDQAIKVDPVLVVIALSALPFKATKQSRTLNVVYLHRFYWILLSVMLQTVI